MGLGGVGVGRAGGCWAPSMSSSRSRTAAPGLRRGASPPRWPKGQKNSPSLLARGSVRISEIRGRRSPWSQPPPPGLERRPKVCPPGQQEDRGVRSTRPMRTMRGTANPSRTSWRAERSARRSAKPTGRSATASTATSLATSPGIAPHHVREAIAEAAAGPNVEELEEDAAEAAGIEIGSHGATTTTSATKAPEATSARGTRKHATPRASTEGHHRRPLTER